VTRPNLKIVRKPKPAKEAVQPFEALLHLRLETARVAMAPSDADAEVARGALVSQCRAASDLIGVVEHDGGEFAGDVCFAARVRVAEAMRTLLTKTDGANVREARHTLYCALVLVAEALRSDETSSLPAPDSAPLGEFAALTLAASRACRSDHAWILDVAQAELVLCTTHPEFRDIDSRLARRLSVVQGEIARWNAKNRGEALASVLVDSIVTILEAPGGLPGPRGA
jgi:hypothetical protein